MSSLYRKYRPAVFSAVIGQDHIRTNLEQALKKGTVGHAYLFSGPRGTGKTTLARLFAKAVNCPKRGALAEPCGKCDICLENARGQAVDIIEIDAASNRGIDEIRELRDKIAFAPSRGKYKIYIIDEVHMLTPPAFNALLKTLEEPPAHAIFILATTELSKLPETIISRCQRFAFHRASDAALEEVLKHVIKTEKIDLDPEAIQVIINRAEGSFRDSLTILGSVMASDQRLTADGLRLLLGLPQASVLEATYQAIITGQADALIVTLRQVIEGGGDVLVLVKALADRLSNQLINGREGAKQNVHLLEQLLLLLARVRQSSDPTALVVARLYDLALSAQPTGTQASRPVMAEQVPPTGGAPAAQPIVTDLQKAEPAEEPKEVDAVTATPASAPKPGTNGDFWSAFLGGIKESNHALYAVLRSAELDSLADDKVIVAVKFRFYSERLLEAKNRKLLEKIASGVAGRPLRLECAVRAEMKVQSPEEDLLSTVVNVFELEEAK